MTNEDERATVFTGPIRRIERGPALRQREKSAFAIDYGYRATNPFSGVHSIGLSISLWGRSS